MLRFDWRYYEIPKVWRAPARDANGAYTCVCFADGFLWDSFHYTLNAGLPDLAAASNYLRHLGFTPEEAK